MFFNLTFSIAKLHINQKYSKEFVKYRKYYYLCPCFTKIILAKAFFVAILQKILLFILMTNNLDASDILILEALQNDGHLTIKELAQRVHLSVSPVYERVRRLEREGYIKGYVAVLDAEKLDCGFMAFCYLKMKQHSHENALQIMERVMDIPEIAEVYNISGDYDFLLKVYVQNMKQYQQFVLRILGDIPAIGSLNSSFVLGEVKNSHRLPLPK